MKILNFVVLCLLAAVTASAQVNVQQAPGAYTNDGVLVRTGTSNKVRNVPELTFDTSNILTAGSASATGAGIKIYTNTNEASSLTLQGGSRYFSHQYDADVYTFSGRDSDTYPIYSFANDGSYRFAFSSGITVGADALDISGVNTFDGSTIRTPSTVPVDEESPDTATFTITNGNEVVTIDEDSIISFSAVGSPGQRFSGTIINSSSSFRSISLVGCTPSTVLVAPLSEQIYPFVSDGSAWEILGGDPYGLPGALIFVVDGAGAAVATGEKKAVVQAQRAGVITGWTVLGNESGSVVVDVWKDTYANYPPVNADSITASAPPTVSAATKATSTTLTDWITSFAAGDVFKVNVDSVTTTTYFTLILHVSYY